MHHSLCFTAPGPPTNTHVVPTNTSTSVVSWTAPTLGEQTCNPREQLTYTVTVSHSDGIFVKNVTGKNVTVVVSFSTITSESVRVESVNSLGSSIPDEWTNQDGWMYICMHDIVYECIIILYYCSYVYCTVHVCECTWHDSVSLCSACVHVCMHAWYIRACVHPCMLCA